jgi:GNAT superfamily N-acetyltransferase
LASFAARLFESTYGDDTPAAEMAAYVAEHFGPDLQRAEIVDPSGCLFVATEGADQTMIGYVHATKDADAMRLNRLYVDQPARGTGLAARLLEAVETQCRAFGLETLRLGVYDQNARAIAFYRRSGFAAVGTTSFHMGQDIQSDLIMEKSLALP